jgi:serine/threonine protein kinase
MHEGMALETPLQTVGDYHLVLKIAEGGMGTVYKASHRQSGQIVAIKIVPAHIAKNPVMVKRFEQEYNAARTIDHPNIVRALEFGREGDCPFLVMEYVEGESLGQRLEREHAIREKEAVHIISQVAQGLFRAHKLGMVHRDVKPDNILLSVDGQAKLADLGLVKELETDLNLTRTGRGLGTPHFMAPEQFRNAKNVDTRCDIYSLAATLYMMVTGELPFKSCGPLDAWMKKVNNDLTPPRQLIPDLSERIDWAIRRSMSSEPSKRPRNCLEFVEDLTGQVTRKLAPISGDTPSDIWYLIYTDTDGVIHTAKGSIDGIRRSVRDGRLGDVASLRVSCSKSGPFDVARDRAEFRDVIVMPEPVIPPPPRSMPPARTPIPPTKSPAPSPSAFHVVTAENKPAPPTLPAATVLSGPAPMIDLDTYGDHGDWFKGLLLLIVAVASAVAGYYLMPIFANLRLP